tara:strand:+ start:2177 stop:2929 length:753 start_codon:yes stop_codon:yes gene_type:complete
MKSHLLLLLVCLSIIGHSKSFRSLSSFNSIEINLVAETEGYKDIHLLAINKSKAYNEVPLKLQYIINNDTLIDYMILKEAIRGDVKTLFLLEGDSLKVLLSIIHKDSVEVKIKGNITSKEPMVLETSDSGASKYLHGNYWDVKQPCIFRVIKRDTFPEILNFQFNFNENFNYNEFYFQVNIISPDSSFKSIESKFNMNSSPFLSFESKIQETIEDFKLKLSGKYIVEIVPFMNSRRINGINSVGYKVVKE